MFNKIPKRHLLLFAIFVTLAACSGKRIDFSDPLRSVEDIFWDVKKQMRKPGEKLVTHPDRVWRQYRCSNRKLPFIQIESNELLPPRLTAGEELNHHLVYVMCPARPAQVVGGQLNRTLYFRGRPLFTDRTPGFEFKPGRWAVDAFITVSPKAQTGVYSLETRFDKRSVRINATQHFVVE